MKILCKLGIHLYKIQWYKDSSNFGLLYETRTCRWCHNKQLKANGCQGDGKWHNIKNFRWGFEGEQQRFESSIPSPTPTWYGYKDRLPV